jgi:hypothetical protein
MKQVQDAVMRFNKRHARLGSHDYDAMRSVVNHAVSGFTAELRRDRGRLIYFSASLVELAGKHGIHTELTFIDRDKQRGWLTTA